MKRNKIIILIILLLLIVATIGVTYSFFTYTRSGEQINKIVMGNIEFAMIDGEDINLSNALPQTDEEGNKNNPYTFTVRNTSTNGITLYYDVSLLTNNDDSSKEYFQNNLIRYSLVKNDIEVIKPSLISSIKGFNYYEKVGEGLILNNQEIEAGNIDRYELRIWIGENVDYTGEIDENGMMVGKYNDYGYSLKIRIDASDSGLKKQVYATLKTGKEVNVIFKQLAGNTDATDEDNDNNITAIKMAGSIPKGVTTRIISEDTSKEQIVAWFDNGIIYIYSKETIMMNNNSERLFKKLNNLIDINCVASWDTSDVVNMYAMFQYCSMLEDIKPLTNWDTSKVRWLNQMFANCTSLVDITPLSNWDVSSSINIGHTFDGTKITNVNALANWEISNVTDMYNLFSNCTFLIDISGLANWDTSSVTDMSLAFKNCLSLSNINALSNWNTSNATIMHGTFKDCSMLEDIKPLTNWDTSKVNRLDQIFANCTSLADITPLSNWDVSSSTNIGHAFDSTKITNVNSLSNWNISSVIDMYSLFLNCTSLIDISGLSNWDTSNVTDMYGIFMGCTSLSNISALSNWNTSNVYKMMDLFNNCINITSFDCIENWDVSNVTSSKDMFLNIPSDINRPIWYTNLKSN